MIQKIYAIYDEKAEAYNAPFPLATDGLAQRSFEMACTNPATDLYKYPGDFKLYCIATWDDSKGSFENIVPAKFIASNVRKNTISEELAKIKVDEEIEEKESKEDSKEEGSKEGDLK